MIRINLIPPEILAQRRDDRRWKWVWLAGGISLLIIALFWAVMFMQVAAATNEVAGIQQQAAVVTGQTSRFAVFQQKEADLRVRKDAYEAASAGRVDWAQMLYELGLVLPNDVYLTTFTGTDAGSGAGANSVVTMAGQAKYDPAEAPANGYKSVAKMLVRLTEMKQLDSVWLNSATLGGGSSTAAPMYTWALNARITPVSTQTASPGN